MNRPATGEVVAVAPFGLNASDPAFWKKGLAVIEGMIDELEAMDRATARRQ